MFKQRTTQGRKYRTKQSSDTDDDGHPDMPVSPRNAQNRTDAHPNNTPLKEIEKTVESLRIGRDLFRRNEYVEVKDLNGKGRGLVARRKIRAGGLGCCLLLEHCWEECVTDEVHKPQAQHLSRKNPTHR